MILNMPYLKSPNLSFITNALVKLELYPHFSSNESSIFIVVKFNIVLLSIS